MRSGAGTSATTNGSAESRRAGLGRFAWCGRHHEGRSAGRRRTLGTVPRVSDGILSGPLDLDGGRGSSKPSYQVVAGAARPGGRTPRHRGGRIDPLLR